MRVVFLDFDGVLNATTGDVDDGGELWTASWLDPTMVGRLAHVVAETRAAVVVSSSWRQRRSVAELDAILAQRGYAGGVLDVTPRLPRPAEGEHHVRANEITAWLADHPDVESFVILDDEEDLATLSRCHVRTDPATGLTETDVERAIAILVRDRT